MKALIQSILLILAVSASGQIQLSGRVTEKSGEPLLGVNVYLRGTYDGATTDVDGNFSFITSRADSLVLLASFIGFKEFEQVIEVEDQEFSIILREEVSQLNAVTITAGSFDASDEKKRVVLKSLDIVTTAGATADIPGALNTLPGTQAVGETGRLFVRGGEGRETKTFIDGMLVHNEYSPTAPNTPGRSRFSPFMFKGMSFSTGGYSAEYGQALSSALILQSKEIAENNRTDISLMSVGAGLSTTRSFERSSFAGKLEYSNLTPYFWLVRQRLNWEKAPRDVTGNFAYRIKTSKSGTLKFYTNLSNSSLDLYEADIANPEVELPVRVTNKYAYLNASYRDVIGKKLGIRGGVSFTRSNDFASIDVNSRDQKISGFHTKLVLDYQYSDRLAILWGAEQFRRNLDQDLEDATGAFQQDFNEGITTTFVESEVLVSNSLAFKGGARVEYNDLIGYFNIAPRISSAFKTSEHSQISLAYGLFHQSPTNQIVLTDPNSGQERASHYIANYQWNKGLRSFRVEGYEKRYSNLARYQNIYDASTFQFDGGGYARGIDLFWRDRETFNNLDYWVSYSYIDTRRRYNDFPGKYIPPFVSNHNFSVVTKKFFEEIKSHVGITYSFASSRRYHNPNSDGFLSGKTPAYHDLSFNISYLYSNQVIVHAMVNNVLGINNIFGYEFANEPNADGYYMSRPIAQPAKRFIFLGVFITLSRNKEINQLPNL